METGRGCLPVRSLSTLLPETLWLKPPPKAAYIGIWLEISDYINLNGAYFSLLNYDHTRSLI